MKIKAKLTLGLGALFIMILLLTALSARYIRALSNDSQNILSDNYQTLEYGLNITSAMDDRSRQDNSVKIFENNLKKQQKNVTETGEQQATDNLTEHFDAYKKNIGDSTVRAAVRKDVFALMKLNMEAIKRKSTIAQQTANGANTWILFTGTLCFLIAFTLLLNFPNSIAAPIQDLTRSIQQIADGNYKERLHSERGDEFGDLATSFNTMAAKLEEYNTSRLEKLMIEKKRIDTLINNLPNPVIGLDENKRIIFINDVALKIAGLKPDEVIGKPAQDVALQNDLIRLLIKDLILPTGNDVINKNKQPIKIFADNKESFFDKEIIPIFIQPTGETQTKHIGDVIILQNITTFKELDFAKTNFIATVSHELKTPISSMMMSAKLLEDKRIGTLNTEQQQLTQSIKDDGERLLRITGELLDMTQAETGKIQLNLKETPPQDIINAAVPANKIQAKQKGITLEIKYPSDIPSVYADIEKTAWILSNFISNAISYSHEGSKIIIGLKNEKNRIKFSVQDFGKGIDSKYKDKIFDRYFQIPGSLKSGTGLGLAIGKEFIEAQGGSIGMESQVGVGSTFFFLLPAFADK